MAAATIAKSKARRAPRSNARVKHEAHDFSLIIMRLAMGLLGLGSLLQASGFHTAGGVFTALGSACGMGSK